MIGKTLAVLALLALAGCTEQPDAPSTTLVVASDGGIATYTLVHDAAARHAQSHYDQHGATHPAFYSAFDQLAQAQKEGRLTFNASYNPQFGFYLADIGGRAGDSAFWKLVVNGKESSLGMGDAQVTANDVVRWELTPFEMQAT